MSSFKIIANLRGFEHSACLLIQSNNWFLNMNTWDESLTTFGFYVISWSLLNWMLLWCWCCNIIWEYRWWLMTTWRLASQDHQQAWGRLSAWFVPFHILSMLKNFDRYVWLWWIYQMWYWDCYNEVLLVEDSWIMPTISRYHNFTTHYDGVTSWLLWIRKLRKSCLTQGKVPRRWFFTLLGLALLTLS